MISSIIARNLLIAGSFAASLSVSAAPFSPLPLTKLEENIIIFTGQSEAKRFLVEEKDSKFHGIFVREFLNNEPLIENPLRAVVHHFKKNQVRAKRIYENKWILLRNTDINSVKFDENQNIYASLKFSSKDFEAVYAYFERTKDGEDDAANIDPDESYTLVCKTLGVKNTALIFEGCRDAAPLAFKIAYQLSELIRCNVPRDIFNKYYGTVTRAEVKKSGRPLIALAIELAEGGKLTASPEDIERCEKSGKCGPLTFMPWLLDGHSEIRAKVYKNANERLKSLGIDFRFSANSETSKQEGHK